MHLTFKHRVIHVPQFLEHPIGHVTLTASDLLMDQDSTIEIVLVELLYPAELDMLVKQLVCVDPVIEELQDIDRLHCVLVCGEL